MLGVLRDMIQAEKGKLDLGMAGIARGLVGPRTKRFAKKIGIANDRPEEVVVFVQLVMRQGRFYEMASIVSAGRRELAAGGQRNGKGRRTDNS